MKNIHVLPTNKPSRLHFDGKLFLSPNYQDSKTINSIVEGRNIYVTSDGEPNEGDWCIVGNGVSKLNTHFTSKEEINAIWKTIILTTDPDLIKDGVQAIDQVWIKDGVQVIDDDFLEWFVKNPSCEFVELGLEHYFDKNIDKPPFFPLRYKIRIPQEDPKFISGQPFLEKADEVIVIHRPKQETLEEVAERLLRDHRDFEVEGDSSYQNGRLNGILEGLKYQSERMYSEEDMKLSFEAGKKGYMRGSMLHQEYYFTWKNFKQWFEQFKKR